jgi:hypothetical protein
MLLSVSSAHSFSSGEIKLDGWVILNGILMLMMFGGLDKGKVDVQSDGPLQNTITR